MMEDDATLVATVTFFRGLRREWLQHPNQLGRVMKTPCPVPDWSEIQPADRQRFLRAMKTALASTKPDNLIKVIEQVRAL